MQTFIVSFNGSVLRFVDGQRTTGIKSFLKCLQIIEFVSAKMLAQIFSALSLYLQWGKFNK